MPSQAESRRIHRTTAVITLAAVLFYLFFQINKLGPLGEINPFTADPYDAVGSFAIQIALLVGILTYARALRIKLSPAQAVKTRLILRGNLLVLAVMMVTLSADAIAEVVRPLPPSYWGNILLLELAAMFLITFTCGAVLAAAFHGVQAPAPPRNLTPADGIDDLWTLVRVPAARFRRILPQAWVAWVERFDSDWLFFRVKGLNPRTHPWRFACALGFLAGVGLILAQLREGLPPNWRAGLLVMGIFLTGELAGTLAGFAVLGGYLGLRPAFQKGI